MTYRDFPSSPSMSGSICLELGKLHVGGSTKAYPGSPCLIFVKCVYVCLCVCVMCLQMRIRM